MSHATPSTPPHVTLFSIRLSAKTHVGFVSVSTFNSLFTAIEEGLGIDPYDVEFRECETNNVLNGDAQAFELSWMCFDFQYGQRLIVNA